jgi:hypothetical protein
MLQQPARSARSSLPGMTVALAQAMPDDAGVLLPACSPNLVPFTAQPVPSPQDGPASDSLRAIGQFGGIVTVGAIRETTAFLGVGPRLVALDISAPERPAVIWRSGVFPNSVSRVTLTGTILVIAYHQPSMVGPSGLAIVDVADPTRPVVRNCTPLSGIPVSLTARDQQVFFLAGRNTARVGEASLLIFDIANPLTPRLLSSTEVHLGGAPPDPSRLVVNGGYAYIGGPNGLHVIDIADPEQPTVLPVLPFGAAIAGLGMADQRHFVANPQIVPPGRGARPIPGAVRILDLSDPRLPVEIAEFMGIRDPQEVAVVGTRAYVRSPTDLVVLDVGDPTQPTELGAVRLQRTRGMAITWPYALVATVPDALDPDDPGADLQLFDLRTGPDPAVVGALAVPNHPTGVAVAGHLAFVIESGARLTILDVSTPTAPRTLGTLLGSRVSWRAIAARAGVVYLGAIAPRLQIVDVADPAAPRLVGEIVTPGSVRRIVLQGSYAYVLSDGLVVADITDAAHPRVVASLDLADPIDLAVVGSRAYLLTLPPGRGGQSAATVHVVDLTDPERPELRGAVTTPLHSGSVGGNARYAFIKGGPVGSMASDQVAVVDTADSDHPTVAATHTVGAGAALQVEGEHLYLAGGDLSGGDLLRVLDVRDPLVPTEVGRYAGPPNARGYLRFAIAGPWIFVGSRQGLWILEFNSSDGSR